MESSICRENVVETIVVEENDKIKPELFFGVHWSIKDQPFIVHLFNFLNNNEENTLDKTEIYGFLNQSMDMNEIP